MDRIVIPRMPLGARVGVTEEEREREQDIAVSLTLHTDLAAAGASDALGDTLDYDAVCEVVTRVVGAGSFNLIETIALRVADAVLSAFDVAVVDVRVEKPEALRARGVPFAAVEIRRGRDA